MLSGRRKLLLADDSPTIQKMIALTFEDEGFEVLAVGDGERALGALESDSPPDVLLADIHMPGPNGYELCERVKQSVRLRHVPVVLLVGSFEPFNEAEARRVGADTVLTKPFQSIRDLVSRVGSLLGGESKREEIAHDEMQAGQPAVEPSTHQADAAALEPAAHAAEGFGGHEAEPHAAHADAFADFSADDELIEAKHADSFGVAPAQADVSSRDQFISGAHDLDAEATLEADEAHARGGAETLEREAFAQPHFDHGEPVAANTQANAEHEEAPPASLEPSFEAGPSSSFAAAHEVGERVMAARASFNARPASAASADDTLLDLGQMQTPAPVAASGDDDFILDLEDDFYLNDEKRGESARPDAPGAFAEAAHGEHTSQPVAAEVFMHDEPQPFTQHVETQGFAAHGESHAPRGFVEPEVVPADAPASFEGDYTDGSVEGDVAKPPAGLYHTNPMFETARSEQSHESNVAGIGASESVAASESSSAGQVGEARSGVEESLGADQLSPEAVERIARRVVELMSDKVVREITWEVVPELAELLIKQWLDEGKLK